MNDPYQSNPYQAPTGDQYGSQGTESIGNVTGHGIVEALRKTRPWVLFLAILGFIITGFLLLGGVVSVVGGVATAGVPNGPPPGMLVGIGIMYVVMGIVYIMPAIYLLRYASRIKNFVYNPVSTELEAALVAQKSFWKFIGIAFLVVIVLQIFVMIAAVFLGFNVATQGPGAPPAALPQPVQPVSQIWRPAELPLVPVVADIPNMV